MEIRKVLEQISEIQGHLARTEVYRGYRALTVAITGGMAVFGAAVQPWVVRADRPVHFVYFWGGVAFINLVIFGIEILYNYFYQETNFERHQTRRTIGQFLPCVGAGFAVTAGLIPFGAEGIRFLPGIWAILFSLGIFSSRPFLPRVTGWAALFYLCAGIILLGLAGRGASLSPWGMGLTFAFGQFFCALIFYWNVERKGGEDVG